jgi:predicted nuclease of predicted toxin-antitoxin system
MDNPSEYEWHEFDWGEVSRMPPGPHKKLKLYADACIPLCIIKELRAAGLPVESATENGWATQPDENIYQRAKKLHKVLLTMDRHFWDDRNHPLQKGFGIIFVDIPPDQTSKAIDGLARFYAIFAKYYPLDWWDSMKARITKSMFVLKYHTYEGRIREEEFQLTDKGNLLTRTTR